MQQPALAPAPHPHGLHQHDQKPAQSQVQPAQAVPQDHADQVLQQQLLAAQAQYDPSQGVPHPPRPQPGGIPHMQHARDHNIDPAISGAAPPSGMIPAPVDVSVTAQDHTATQMAQAPQPPQPERKTYGKRELSTSKRAAQNRAAQRAFRARKEQYIQKMEAQVKDMEALTEAYKSIQAENYQLREYIIELQARLIDLQSEVPEIPGGINVHQHRPTVDQVITHTPAHEAAVAAAAAAANSANTVTTSSDQSGATTATAPPTQPPAPSHQHVGVPVSYSDQQSADQQMNQLNRIAVAGLGMRRPHHEEAAYLANPSGNAGPGANPNVTSGMNGPPPKRPRTDGADDSGLGGDSQGQNLGA